MAAQDASRFLKPTDVRKIARYVTIGNDLYRRGFSIPLLKCVSPGQVAYIMDELHNGVCGLHTGSRALKARALREGYYWPTMEEDAKAFTTNVKDAKLTLTFPMPRRPSFET